jgi:hypothetical protein
MNYHDYFRYSNGKLWWKPRMRGLVHTKPVGRLNKGYKWVRCPISGRQKGLHRIIWEMHRGPIPDGMVIDHIDRDPLNNELANLRLASRSENSCNAKGKSCRRANLPKNVYVDFTYKGVKKYRMQICTNGEVFREGGMSLDDAIERVEEFRSKHQRDYAPKFLESA